MRWGRFVAAGVLAGVGGVAATGLVSAERPTLRTGFAALAGPFEGEGRHAENRSSDDGNVSAGPRVPKQRRSHAAPKEAVAGAEAKAVHDRAADSPGSNDRTSSRTRLDPPGPDASREERVAYARDVVARVRRAASGRRAGAESHNPGTVGKYPDEQRTQRDLVLSAVVAPDDRAPFAVIEHEQTGVVASYRPGTMLWPGVLPGVWVVDVQPGVVHLLDLASRDFEFLTFERPMTDRERRAYKRRQKTQTRRRAAKQRRRGRRR